MAVANKTALVENLPRVIAASFGDLPHSLNLFQSGMWEGSAGPPARKRHPAIGRSSCRGHDASSRCVRRVNGAPRKPVTSFPSGGHARGREGDWRGGQNRFMDLWRWSGVLALQLLQIMQSMNEHPFDHSAAMS